MNGMFVIILFYLTLYVQSFCWLIFYFFSLLQKCFVDSQPQDHPFELFDQFECSASTLYNTSVNNPDMISQLDLHRYSLNQEFDNIVGHNSDLIAQFDSYQDYNHNTLIKKLKFNSV